MRVLAALRVVLLLVALVACEASRGQQIAESSPASAPARQSAQSDEALTVNIADWLGTYWYGYSMSRYSLRLKPDGTFRFDEHACMGVLRSSSGTYRIVDDLLILDRSESDTASLCGRRFVPVRWGERHYLIPEAIRYQFRAAIVCGREPRCWKTAVYTPPFFLRESEWELPVSGVPTTPARWQDDLDNLVPVNIKATVVGLRDESGDPDRHCAVLDRGGDDGLKAGITVSVPPSEGGTGESRLRRVLTLAEVNPDTSVAGIDVDRSVDRDPPHGVKVGDVVEVHFCVAGPEPPPAPLSPAEIEVRARAEEWMTQAARAYATCRSYADEGTVEIVFVKEEGNETNHEWFSTRFARPDRFRFARGAVEAERNVPARIVAVETNVTHRWDHYSKHWKPLPGGPADALGNCSGASHIAPLLLPDDEVRTYLLQLKDLRVVGEEAIDGASCVKLEGTHPNDCRWPAPQNLIQAL